VAEFAFNGENRHGADADVVWDRGITQLHGVAVVPGIEESWKIDSVDPLAKSIALNYDL